MSWAGLSGSHGAGHGSGLSEHPKGRAGALEGLQECLPVLLHSPLIGPQKTPLPLPLQLPLLPSQSHRHDPRVGTGPLSFCTLMCSCVVSSIFMAVQNFAFGSLWMWLAQLC